MARDLYLILEVERVATADEIKRSYRRLARQYHPDTNPGNAEAEERFKEISVAYEVLSNPEQRQRYDQFGEAGIGNGSAGQGAGAFGFGDLFEHFFGGDPFRQRGPAAHTPHRGADIETVVSVSLLEAALGHTVRINVKVHRPCQTCSSTGAKPGTTKRQCETCHGAGEVRQVRRTMLGQMVTSSVCSMCGGFGESILDPCADCHGDGRVAVSEELDVEIPAGIDNEQRLRLQGLGASGLRGGPNGDCYVHIRVKADPRFKRIGTELNTILVIGVAQATLGADCLVPTLEGEESVHIPAGTQPGTVIRLDGHGMPPLHGRRRGPLVVHVNVVVPTDLSEDAELALRTFATEVGESVAEPKKGLLSRLRSKL